jgi:UDP-glucose 4-epimerase
MTTEKDAIPRKILITGSSGSLGSILTEYYCKKGISIIGIDIIEKNNLPVRKKVKFYRESVRDIKKMEEIFFHENPTHILHLAWSYNRLRDQKEEYENDVVGTKNILDIADRLKSVKQFIFFSSASAYGAWSDNYLWMPEDQELRPGEYRYGLNKKRVEELLNQYISKDGIKINILRVCTVVGPHYDKKRSAVSMLIKFPFMMKVSQSCELQLLHEEDLFSMMDLILDDQTISGTYNIAPDDYATVKELIPDKPFYPVPIKLIKVIFGILWNVRIINLHPSCLNASRYGIVIDPSKFVKRYDYQYKYSTIEAFKETVINNQLD